MALVVFIRQQRAHCTTLTANFTPKNTHITQCLWDGEIEMTDALLGDTEATQGAPSEVFFSIVVPVYKTEEYLAETLDSILGQDADLLRQTEVIIVNDGSPDNSEVVCLEYANKYPNLIRYILQENQGVSVARNRGIEEARGTLVGFIDSDDVYEPNFLREIYNFWLEHENEVDVMAAPLQFFDSATGSHPLNFKYDEGTRVLDITDEYTGILLHITGAFIYRQTLIETGLRFAEGRKYAEDKLFLTELVMVKKKYGLVTETNLLYRKRSNKSSAIQRSVLDPDWYIDTLLSVDSYLMQKFAVDGVVPPYVQYVVAYDLQWRVKQEEQHLFTLEEQKEYIDLFVDLLKNIDNQVIMDLRNVFSEHKTYLLKMKHGEDPLENSQYSKGGFEYQGIRIAKYYNGGRISTINLAKYNDGKLTLEGYFFGLRFKGIKYGYFVNSEFIEVTLYDIPRAQIRFLGETVFDRNVYKVELNVRPGDRIRPAVLRPNGSFIKGVFLLKDMSRIPEGTSSYVKTGDIILQNVRNTYLAVKENTFKERQRRELSFIRHTIFNETRRPSTMTGLGAVWLRTVARIRRALQGNRRIWLISDRPNSAGDNGEAFFQYLLNNQPENVVPYFVLSKKSKDYQRLSSIGKVVEPGSRKFKGLFLRADKIISSQANDYVINAFSTDQNIFRDLYRFDFVFLQHGVTLHDISSWLHSFSKDIRLFVTSAFREQESIIHGKYGYDEKTVVLTGFPRHDKLIDRKSKKIIVAPTWRHGLVGEVDPKTLTVPYNEEFMNSEFFQFYQSLIADPRLNRALKQYGYTAEFLIHPGFSRQIEDFEGTENFTISTPPHNYNKAFAEAALMVTDYSSVAFDFAYLRKPVIYAQFDKESFYQWHLWGKGYFSFERDGFGPVVQTLDSLVDSLIESIAEDCALETKYAQRVDEFFGHQDKNSSQRLLAEILKLDDSK